MEERRSPWWFVCTACVAFLVGMLFHALGGLRDRLERINTTLERIDQNLDRAAELDRKIEAINEDGR